MTGIPAVQRRGAEARLALLPFAFFLTGATSLVFESVWFRRLTILFGSTGYAAATVFTAFMAGLALGSLAAGRIADRPHWDRARLLRAYAIVEACIGIAALVLPLSGESLLPVLALGNRMGHGVLWGALFRFVLALAVLIVPTTLMGATLPLAGKAFAERGGGHLGSEAGRLYAANTLGAVAGTLATGFVLLPAVGVRVTTFAAAATNLTVAALVLFLARSVEEPGSQSSLGRTTAASAGPSPLRSRLALLVFAVSGGVAMIYEEVWQRALQLVIGSSAYSFAILLSSYLFGLASGAWVYSRRTASQPGQAQNLAIAELLVAGTAAAGLLFLDDLPAVFLVLIRMIPQGPVPALLAQAALAGSVVLLPTFFLGMLFPAMLSWHAGSAQAPPRHGSARAIGQVYSANTAGAIVGSFLGGFVLIPLLGLQRSLVALVVGSALAGLAFAALGASRRGTLVVAAAVVAVIAFVPSMSRPWNLRAMNAGVFRLSTASEVAAGIDQDQSAAALPRATGLQIDDVVRTGFEPVRRSVVLEHHDGITTTVAVTETTLGTRAPGVVMTAYALRVNGKPDASLTVRHRAGEPPVTGTVLPSGDMETQVLSGALPLFLDLPAGDALVIGWGSGVTVATLSRGLNPAERRRVVAVELEAEVIRASRVFAGFVAPDARRVLTRLEDGRNLLLLDPRRYAAIVSEPSNPWVSGASNLFTEEFFRLVRRRLASGGVFVQWLQAYEISVDSVRSVLAALVRAFPSVTVLRMVHSRGDLLLVCGDRPARWREPASALPSVLATIGVRTAEDVASRVIVSGQRVRTFSRGAIPNRDDHPFVEFRAPLDLVRFGRWGSDVIVRALAGRLDRPPEAAGLDRARLARALVSAGRPRAALALGPAQPVARAAQRMLEARAAGLSEHEAWTELPERLAAWRAGPGEAGRRMAVADAYLALGYPERAAALYLAVPPAGIEP
ncbi:MAG: fused MFS/spermidine synthase [Deltaproteobacteria bacterium]|nr:fused MFS/spermidine synthase [Deltaproteobacteria bacterium]